MSGYSRQSAASIVPTAVVRATPINDEFNALRDAFILATGHKHDGTTAEGAYVPTISDTNNRNKVVIDSANNRISLFVNVSSSAAEQLRIIDGAIIPVVDDDIDLGSSSFEFKNLFIDGTANIDSLIADTASIAAGSINNAVIGNSTPAAGTFTTITANVSATIASVAISGGTINNTVIGGTTPAAGTFTNLTVNSAATIASAAISAGTINNTVIGGTTAAAITGTTITANTGFTGNLTGNVTGNVTASSGTSTFNNATVNGTLTATLTGNVSATTGTSTFNNVTITGGLNMDAGTSATITNLTSPTNTNDAATKGYVDTSIANLIDTAPGTLDTLNELAAALGDDPNFATTVTNEIATKLALAGGTMSGAIAMGTNKITGMGDPTSNQDAATKIYVDTQRDTRLALSGGTMSGVIAMGTNKITGLGDPTANQDAATKVYVDGILGSATSAATSAAAAATSASNAATSASNASTSETNAAASASAAAASYDSFDDRYLGPKASNPTLDNDGNALLTGALYFNTTAGEMRVWNGSSWLATYLPSSAYLSTSGGTLSGDLTLNAQSDLRFADADSSNWVAFQAPSTIASNITWTLPSADGTSGQVLSTNGTGTLSWTTASPASATSVSEGVVYGRTIFFGNTSLGGLAMQAVTGTGNTAVGALAYRAEGGSAATNNTIIGANSASNLSTGGSNSTLGNSAGSALTTGTQNTLLGASAGASGTNNLTTGSNNTIIGFNAAASSATVSNETTIGNVSASTFRVPGVAFTLTGSKFTWGSNSNGVATSGIAFGFAANQAGSGAGNICIGDFAGRFEGGNTGGSNIFIGGAAGTGSGSSFSSPFNVGVGASALQNVSGGGYNTAVGTEAGDKITTGTNNLILGYSAASSGTNDLTTGTNNTVIGYNAATSSATVSNTVTLGNSSITTLRCQVTTITSLSDARDKANISDLPAGLNFVKALRPVEFDWNMRDGGKVGVYDTGFIAQELKAAQESTGVNIPGLVFEDNPDRLEAGYGKLIPVLVKAIQELSAEVQNLKAQLKGN